MRAKQKGDMPLAAAVLRGIAMQAQPHALVRPGRQPAGTIAGKVHALASSVRPEPAMDPRPVLKPPAYEQAFAEGRQEGYVAGRSAATTEGREALQQAIDDARKHAAEGGWQEGLREGRKEAQVELEQARAEANDLANAAVEQRLAQLDKLLKTLAAAAAERLADAEDDLVSLGHETLCRMLGQEAATPAAIRTMVKHLLVQHGQRAELAVHVHPDDLQALVQEGVAADSAWRWVGDNSVQLGGVILRSPEGSLDARLETQLSALSATLLAVRRDRKAIAQ